MAVIVIGIVVAIDIVITATAKMTRNNFKVKDIVYLAPIRLIL